MSDRDRTLADLVTTDVERAVVDAAYMARSCGTAYVTRAIHDGNIFYYPSSMGPLTPTACQVRLASYFGMDDHRSLAVKDIRLMFTIVY